MILGSTAIPGTLTEERKEPHPVIDAGSSFLFGGTIDGKWLSEDDMAKWIKGGEKAVEVFGGGFGA